MIPIPTRNIEELLLRSYFELGCFTTSDWLLKTEFYGRMEYLNWDNSFLKLSSLKFPVQNIQSGNLQQLSLDLEHFPYCLSLADMTGW